jgi:hypothetical protein
MNPTLVEPYREPLPNPVLVTYDAITEGVAQEPSASTVVVMADTPLVRRWTLLCVVLDAAATEVTDRSRQVGGIDLATLLAHGDHLEVRGLLSCHDSRRN